MDLFAPFLGESEKTEAGHALNARQGFEDALLDLSDRLGVSRSGMPGDVAPSMRSL